MTPRRRSGGSSGRPRQPGVATRPDPDTRRQVERYFSYRERYASWAEPLVRFFRGDPPCVPCIPGSDDLPWARSLRFMEERTVVRAGGGPAWPSISWTTWMISCIRPGPGLRHGALRRADSRQPCRFATVSEAANRIPDRRFYRPGCVKQFGAVPASEKPDLSWFRAFPGAGRALPRPGKPRSDFGPVLRVALGGGYVSTELRRLADARYSTMSTVSASGAG
jgi:hypothetical protein